MAVENITNDYAYRQCMTTVVAAICTEAGYESAEEVALETLTEMLQSYMCEIANTTRSYYEHSGRTLPTGRDVLCALADMGFPTISLPHYAHRARRINLGSLGKTNESATPAVLQVGKRKNFSSYVSTDYNFPHFPDPHAYIRTTTGQKPETDYVILRERLSIQKRDVERALTRFVAKTGKSHPLLPHDKNAFPLIAAESSFRPYLAALLPSEYETLKANENVDSEEEKDADSKSKHRKIKKKKGMDDQDVPSPQATSQSSTQTNELTASQLEQSSIIHNPYLRPVKKAKSKKKL